MRLLFYPFVLLFNIIKKNPAKIIWLIVAILSFNFSNIYSEDVIEKIEASYVIKSNNRYTYFFDAGDNKYTKMETDKPLKSNTYYYKRMQTGFVLLRILTCFASIIVVIFSFGLSGDSRSRWEIEDCIKESLLILITCELEDGKYYYMALGRLVKVTTYKLHFTDNISYYLGIRGFTDILNCPKFKTKRQNRSEKLDKILK